MSDLSLQAFPSAFGGVLHQAHQHPDLVITILASVVVFIYQIVSSYEIVSSHYHYYYINGIVPFSLRCYWYILIKTCSFWKLGAHICRTKASLFHWEACNIVQVGFLLIISILSLLAVYWSNNFVFYLGSVTVYLIMKFWPRWPDRWGRAKWFK